MTRTKILYVEDNDDLRSTIGMLLEADDRDVLTCATGEEALALMNDQPFDVLVTDVNLPGISGTDLARRVLATRPEQWIVLCSGYEFRQGLAQLGPNVRSLTKSFEPEELEAMMNEIVAAVHAGAGAKD